MARQRKVQDPLIEMELEQGNALINEEKEEEIVKYLISEIEDVLQGGEREKMEKSISKWKRQREGRPEQEKKSFPWEGACFHEDVEILTENGWDKIKNVQIGAKVLSREPLTGKSMFKPVVDTFEFDAPSDGLLRLKNLFFDVQVTGNHKFLLESKNKKKIKIVTAEEIYSGFKGQTSFLLPLTSEVIEDEIISMFGHKTEDFMEFAGWFISEGWTYKHKCLGIAQSEKANPENVEKIKNLLERLNWDYSFNGTSFLINVESNVAEFFRQLGRSWEKFIPRELLSSPKHQLKFLFDALIAGDGTICWAKDKHRNYPKIVYFTTSKRLADDVQELSARLGYSASISCKEAKNGGKIGERQINGNRKSYVVSIRFTQNTRFRQDRNVVEYVPYSGKVYCVDVEDWHTIYVRQNGLPLWTMNSNVVVPLAMQITNSIYSFVKQMLASKKPLWTVTSADSARANHAKGITELLNALGESPNHIKFNEARNTIIYEAISLGTQFVKIPWVTDKWSFKKRIGRKTETVTTIKQDTPKAIAIPMEDFITRSYWSDVQRAPWVGSVIHLMEHELLQRSAQGIYNKEVVEEIVQREGDDLSDERKETLKRIGVSSDRGNTKMYDIYEVFVYWDVDDDGIPEDLIIWIDSVTGKVLRSEFNDIGKRPLVKVPYIERPNELFAIGVGWMCEHMQDEIDTLHNMRVDGTLLSMCQMYVTRRNSSQGVDETFRPLKNITVDDPSKDFVVVKFPDIGYTTLQAEMVSKEYADRVTGASDAMLGYENRATSARTTASGTMFLAQQGAKSLTSIQETIENAFSEIGETIVFQLIRNRERIIPQLPKLISQDNIPAVTEFLNTSIEDIPLLYTIKVQTTPSNLTEEAKRQNLLTLTQLYTMFGEKMLQLASMIYTPDQMSMMPPEVKEIATKFFIGSATMLERIFKFFSIDDVDDYVPYVKDIKMMMELIENMKDQKLKVIGGQLNAQLGQNMQTIPTQSGGSSQFSQPMGNPGNAGGMGEAVEASQGRVF